MHSSRRAKTIPSSREGTRTSTAFPGTISVAVALCPFKEKHDQGELGRRHRTSVINSSAAVPTSSKIVTFMPAEWAETGANA